MSLEKSTPTHHTAAGFRNYLYEPDEQTSTTPGIGFYFRRLRGSFFPPEVPTGRAVPEKEALEQLDALKDLKE